MGAWVEDWGLQMLDTATRPDRENSEPDAPPPDRVVLSHRLFTLMPDAAFQLAPDGVPVLAMPIGDRRALIPVRGLMAELGISASSADGRVLAALPEALTYVNWLALNDPLPPEIVTGDASWSPAPEHCAAASRRVHDGLLRWYGRQGGVSPALVRAAAAGTDDDDIRRAIQQAFERAAGALRLTSPGAVIAEMEALARDIAYIEALRVTLLQPVYALSEQIRGLGGGGRLDLSRADLLSAVSRLMARAKSHLGGRFADADAVLDGDFMAVLRDADLKSDTLRAARDGLHRTRRAWTGLLEAWDAPRDDQAQWRRMEQTYRFLAPRHMPVAEWAKSGLEAPSGRAGRECVVW